MFANESADQGIARQLQGYETSGLHWIARLRLQGYELFGLDELGGRFGVAL